MYLNCPLGIRGLISAPSVLLTPPPYRRCGKQHVVVAGPSNPKPSQSTRKLTPAEQKAHKQRQLEEKRRRMQARVVAEMQADVGDKFVPEVHGAAAVKKPKAEIGAGGAQTAKKPKLDSRLPSTASGHNLKQSPGVACLAVIITFQAFVGT